MTPYPVTAADNTTGPPSPSLLSDDLVIVSRQRAREPELPAATVEAALTATVAPDLARYDVIELPAPLDASRLALDFARHGHRVLSLIAATPGAEPADPGDGIATVPVTLPDADQLSRDAVLLATLAKVRETASIEAAVLLLRDPAWADAAVRARERWGWRVVVEAERSALVPRLERAAGVIVTDVSDSDTRSGAGAASRRHVRRIDRAAGWDAVDAAIRATFPLASIVVISYDNLAFTRLCLASLLANTDYPNYELILIDNGSSDGSAEELQAMAGRYAHLRVILNQRNLGFGAANNQGLGAARGDILVLLNNDTILPRGWLTRLVHHLADPRLGLVGPATNRTGNEAQAPAPYATYGEFVRFARERARTHDGERHPIRMLMMFCVAWRRDVFDQVGLLDERYETGMFEDEDYALRVKAAGYETAWAADAFVHHAYHASIGKLLPSGEYLALFRRNQERFEQKWGICWERHRLPPASSPPAPSGDG